MAPYNMSVTFLGTCSGGGPIESRNCSSLVLDVLGDRALWMVDCAEGTLRQFLFQPYPRYLDVNKVRKIFVTHMHADHTMGIIMLLRSLLGAPLPDKSIMQALTTPKIELYGPAGLREFVRAILKMTLSDTAERYVVHELLTAEHKITPCTPEVMHESELPGRDLRCDPDGLWRKFASEGTIHIDAGPIDHRAPCIGYVFHEEGLHGRKLVILGDTSDPSPIIPLALDATLLVHEATDSHIPVAVDPTYRGNKKTSEVVRDKVVLKGHSTASMAGAFAQSIRAQQLVLNHISGKFPAPTPGSLTGKRSYVMAEIERQASEAWQMGLAQAAYDFLRIEVPPQHPVESGAMRSLPIDDDDGHDDGVTIAPILRNDDDRSARGGFSFQQGGRGRGRGGGRGGRGRRVGGRGRPHGHGRGQFPR